MCQRIAASSRRWRGGERGARLAGRRRGGGLLRSPGGEVGGVLAVRLPGRLGVDLGDVEDRKSTRLNSSHDQISYAVFCLKKKKKASHGFERVLLMERSDDIKSELAQHNN